MIMAVKVLEKLPGSDSEAIDYPEVHLGCVERYRDEIVDFIFTRVKNSQSRVSKYGGKEEEL